MATKAAEDMITPLTKKALALVDTSTECSCDELFVECDKVS